MATGLFNLKQVNQAISQGAWSGYIAPRWVEYLVVAGGGSGGGNGGGGGAGGLLTGIVTVAAGTSYSVTVGAGGTGGVYPTQANGNNSVFGSISATAGGKGGGDSVTYAPGSGGSGGGSGYYASIGQGTSGQGNAGGAQNGLNSGGGGGGAGTVGLNGASTTIGGNGGAGIASAITGTVVTYAGGGAGWANTPGTGGTGGVGGGGSAGAYQGVAGSGGGNTGGGGAGSAGGSGTSGSGGSGIVVVRYPGNVQFYTGGTVTYSNGYIVHNFTANGTLAPTTPTVVSEYQISRSLRFNPADSAYLNRTPGSATNQRTWTWSAWVKRSTLDDFQTLFSASSSGSANYLVAIFFADNKLDFAVYGSGGAQEGRITSTAVYRDVSAWYHVVAVMDTTQATSSNRLQFYVNGVQVTAFGTASYPTQNNIYGVNSTVAHTMGTYSFNTTLNFFKGYMTEVNFIDGQALTPTSFGYVNPTTGIWSPAKYVGGYGTNGFYLNFSDNSNTTAATLGADYSGNGNNWTPNNFSVTAGAGNDSLVDSPTNYGTDTGAGGTVRGNYSTWNPLTFYSTGTIPTFTNGNLDVSVPASAGLPVALGTFVMPSGQWYWEVTITSGGAQMVGIANSTAGGANSGYTTANGWYYYSGGQKYNNNVDVAYGTSFTVGDVIGVALDIDAGTLVFYKNGASQGTAYSTGLTGKTFVAALGNGASSTAQGYTGNFGQRAFANTAPSGFKALCTQNLPTPTIGATTATQAGKYFNAVTYTGTGSSLGVTGVGFQPDWVWVKSRSAATDHGLYDAVRGVQKQIESNTTTAETTETTGITAFGADGFTTGALAQLNTSAATYVAWNWKANGSGSSNTAGSITSTVSASTTSGFSVVTYTGNGTAGATIGHGLGATPAFFIIKSRSRTTNDWKVWCNSFTNTEALLLNTTNAKLTGQNTFLNSTSPTSSVITLGTDSDVNFSSATYVAYCFAAVAGYSAFGSYTGNSSTDGPFVFTGFRPAFVMIKASSLAGESWYVVDATRSPYNAATLYLVPNTTGVEASPGAGQFFDFVSNGFKLRVSGAYSNASGETYIYMAFASNPFKYSLAR